MLDLKRIQKMFLVALFILSLSVSASEITPVLSETPLQDSELTLLDRDVAEITSERSASRRVYNVKSRYELTDPVTRESSVMEQEERIVEVGSGLCYQDNNGQWQLSQIEWQATDGGFIIEKASYKLEVGNTLDSWMEYTLHGKKAKFKPARIESTDGTKAKLLASADSKAQGGINSEDPSRLIFENAFGKGVDLEIQAKLNGYHQNVIFRDHPLASSKVAKEDTQVSVVTEVDFEEDQELVELAVDRENIADLISALSEYSLFEQEQELAEFTLDQEDAVSRLSTLSEFNAQKKDLHIRRKRAGNDSEESQGWFRFADSKVFDKQGIKKSTTSAEKQIQKESDGKIYLKESLNSDYFDAAEYPVVWDYEVVGGISGLTHEIWFANETYYVSSDLTLPSGDSLLIEPGTVVKFNTDAKLERQANSTLHAVGEPLLPIIFTSKNDNTVGAVITGSTGSPANGDFEGISIISGGSSDSETMEFCRIQYAQNGISAQGSVTIRHNIIGKCGKGIYLPSSGFLTIANNLIVNCTYGLYSNFQTSAGCGVSNCTLDSNYHGISVNGNYGYFMIYNSLLTGSFYGIYSSQSISPVCCAYYGNYQNTAGQASTGQSAKLPTSSPYETALTYLGEHYLNDDSGAGALLIDGGSGTIDSSSYYPGGSEAWAVHHVPSGRCFVSTTVSPYAWQPQSDTCDTGTLAIGYHHPRIDYYISGAEFGLYGELTVQPGSVIVNGWPAGIVFSQQTTGLISKGYEEADGSIDFVRWISLHRASALSVDSSSSAKPYVGIQMLANTSYDIRFTKIEGFHTGLSISGASGTCEGNVFNLNGGGISHSQCTDYTVRNCLLKNNSSSGISESGGYGTIEHCTFMNNLKGVSVSGTNNGDVIIRNNLFHHELNLDTKGIYKSGGADIDESYNAFYNLSSAYSDSSGGLTLDTTDFTYPNVSGTRNMLDDPLYANSNLESFFEQRYCLSASTPLTIIGGYDPTSSGMPGFTTQVDRSVDVSPVDIGYHSLLEGDTDGDGFYDYEEYSLGTNAASIDSDGDGLVDGASALFTVDEFHAAMGYYGISLDGTHVVGESTVGSDPTQKYSDADGVSDGREILCGTDPTDPSESPADSLTLYVKKDVSTPGDGQSWANAIPSIQMAIDWAIDGDEINAASGSTEPVVYYEQLDMKGKNLNIHSAVQSGSLSDWERTENTIIDAQGKGAVVQYYGSENSESRLEGFTLRGGHPVGELVLHLMMDETMGDDAIDSSGKERDGSLSFLTEDPVTTWTYGYYNGALEFDGDDYVEIEDWKGITGTGSRTCSAWIKTTNQNAGQVISWGADSPGQKWQVGVGNGVLRTYVYSGNVQGTTRIDDGNWHHIAAVLEDDGSPSADEIEIYVDGVKEVLSSSTAYAVNTGNYYNVKIGRWDGIYGTCFEGCIDDVRVYSRAMDADEIRNFADNYPNLIAHYKLDSDDVSCIDSVGSYPGTLEGTAAIEPGVAGTALMFDGSVGNYVQLDPLFDPGQDEFSVFVWTRLDGKNGTSYQTILAQENVDGNGRPLLSRKEGSDVLCCYLGGVETISQTTVFGALGQWHHVGLTYDGQYVSLYVDGIKEAIKVRAGEQTNGGLRLAQQKDGIDYTVQAPWNGALDDVRIYNYAISESEVKAIYGGNGGGIHGSGARVAISNCIIANNISSRNGSGISNVSGSIVNTIINDNHSYGSGGGLAGCDGIIENCTIVNNAANDIGGLFNCSGELNNLIVWDNMSDLSSAQTDYISMPTYSCLEGFQPDEYGNINYYPYFVDSTNGDFHLDSYSPCIDAGDDSDYANEPSPNGSRVNMGAYGNTGDATYSWLDTGDTDEDGLPDAWETENFTGDVDPEDDADGDRVSNLDEYYAGTDPTNSADFAIPLWWYMDYGIDPELKDVLTLDPDEDGVTNFDEFVAKTNPQEEDSDGDGVPDGWEITYKGDIGMNPAVYDSWTTTVGGIPGIWWYTWWAKTSANPTMQAFFVPSDSHAQDDLDDDGVDNLNEYKEGTDPTQSNSEDSWVEYTHDDAGNQISEKQMVYDRESVGIATCLSETVHEYDELGRRWRTRQKSNPDDNISNVYDAVSLTEYNVDSSVKRTIRKGYASDGTANDDAAAYEAGDVVVAYTYDSLGRQMTVTDASDETTTYSYASDTGLLDYVLLPDKSGLAADERKMEYVYDEIGRVTATIRPDGNYETKKYDSLGHVTTSMLYETVGNPDVLSTETDDSEVTQRRMEYDNLGTMVTNVVMADASNTGAYATATDRVTVNDIEYDDIDKTVCSIVYADSGRVVDSTQSESEQEYDASGRGLPTLLIKGYAKDENGYARTDQPLIEQHLVYNASGQVTQKTVEHYSDQTQSDSVATYTYMVYDDYGRLEASVADGDTAIETDDLRTEFVYWGTRKIQQIDPKGLVTAYDYDAFGHMIAKTEDAVDIDGNDDGDLLDAEDHVGLKRTTEYTYDRLGNLVKITADDDNTDNDPTPTVQETLYTYDVSGNVTTITYPDAGTIEYVYGDPAAGGRPTERTDQRNITLYYEYNKLGSLVTKQNDDANPTVVETYTYDPRGLMLTANKGTSATSPDDTNISAVTFDYSNGLGHLEQTTQSVNGGTPKTIAYDRNQIGKPTKITYPDSGATEIGYSYTSLGQVDEIHRDPDGTTPEELADYDYIGSLVDQRVYELTFSDITFTPTYDEFGRIETHTTENSSGNGVDFEYTYDANGNIENKIFHHRDSQTPPSNIYGYDDLNRLITSAYLGTGTETFNYDLLGNRNSVGDTRTGGGTDTYGDNNEVNEYTTITMAGDTQKTVAHDAAGNLTADHRGYSYEYDDENRLVAVKKSSGTVTVAEFTYDALGRRIEMVNAFDNSVSPAASTTTRYYYDDQRVLLESDYDAAADTETDVRYYVYGNYIDEVLVMNDIAQDDDYYYGHDHLYSVVALFDAAGDVVERYEYDAYGKVHIMDASYGSRTASVYANPYLFTGRRLDTMDGGSLTIYHYRARGYDADTGRFIQRDPAHYIDGMNLYEYVSSSPVINFDAYGLRKQHESLIDKDWGDPDPEGELCQNGGCYGHCYRISTTIEYTGILVGQNLSLKDIAIEGIKAILEGIAQGGGGGLAPGERYANAVLITERRSVHGFSHYDCKTKKLYRWREFKEYSIDRPIARTDEGVPVSFGQYDKQWARELINSLRPNGVRGKWSNGRWHGEKDVPYEYGKTMFCVTNSIKDFEFGPEYVGPNGDAKPFDMHPVDYYKPK